jgi:hypothetical protein
MSRLFYEIIGHMSLMSGFVIPRRGRGGMKVESRGGREKLSKQRVLNNELLTFAADQAPHAARKSGVSNG